jgi:hypothetical protein
MVLIGQLQELLVAVGVAATARVAIVLPVAAATTAAVWVCLWVSTPTGDLDGVCQHGHRVVLLARRMTWSVPVRTKHGRTVMGHARCDRVVRLLHQASSSNRAGAGSRG